MNYQCRKKCIVGEITDPISVEPGVGHAARRGLEERHSSCSYLLKDPQQTSRLRRSTRGAASLHFRLECSFKKEEKSLWHEKVLRFCSVLKSINSRPDKRPEDWLWITLICGWSAPIIRPFVSQHIIKVLRNNVCQTPSGWEKIFFFSHNYRRRWIHVIIL